ncbi:TetR family transcriptional regulator [Streptomyces sp. NPDC050704]|uniref:TetR/AcrR family transcriptional regulator n=1 Tax=Streptomyces sp. NPDC050704 TaxID=3157219 RepID=UPI003426378B
MEVPHELVQAAIRTAHERGMGVADLPIAEIAAAAGISRSTLLRRLGGTRRTLDEAVRSAGVDPGGRPPVRDRAVVAAATLIGEHGLAAATLEAVAAAAECSLPSLHAVFDGRDGLLAAVFERYTPVADLEAVLADTPDNPEETVRLIYRTFVDGFSREPQVFPAVLADALARPTGPGRDLWMRKGLPRLVGSVGAWLTAEVAAGRFKPLPLPIMAHLLMAPLGTHLLVRPALASFFGPALPSVDEAVDSFAQAFLAAVTADGVHSDAL